MLVGGITFCLNIGLTWAFLSQLKFDYKIAISIAYIFTVAVHFSFNKFFTFDSGEHPIIADGIRYALMLFLNYLITLILSIICVEVFEFGAYIGIIFSTVLIASLNYLLMRHFVFQVQGAIQ